MWSLILYGPFDLRRKKTAGSEKGAKNQSLSKSKGHRRDRHGGTRRDDCGGRGLNPSKRYGTRVIMVVIVTIVKRIRRRRTKTVTQRVRILIQVTIISLAKRVDNDRRKRNTSSQFNKLRL